MSTTCDLDASGKTQAPFVVEKAVHNIMFIKHHMKRQDEFDAVRLEFITFSIMITEFHFKLQEDQDWGIVAMVLDRLFLYVFGFTALLGSFMILSKSPEMSEDMSPIDIIYSKIAKEESRMFEEKLFA